MVAPDRRTSRRRDERGVVLPSPVIVLTVIAVAMAAVAFLATRGGEPTEREVTVAADTTPSATPSDAVATPTTVATPTPTPKPKPAVDRAKTFVEVYNNSGIKGLAGGVAARADEVGWQVVGADNWYGSIPATTVYFPPRLAKAADRLALDLGVQRTAPAVDPMQGDRLTLILTGPLD